MNVGLEKLKDGERKAQFENSRALKGRGVETMVILMAKLGTGFGGLGFINPRGASNNDVGTEGVLLDRFNQLKELCEGLTSKVQDTQALLYKLIVSFVT